MMLRLPIRVRLTLVFAGLLLLVLAVTAGLLYRTIAAHLDATIEHRLRSLTEELTLDMSHGETAVLRDIGSLDTSGLFAQILNDSGEIVETSAHAPSSLPLLGAADIRTLSVPALLQRPALRSANGTPAPARAYAARTPSGIVVSGTLLAERNQTLAQLAGLLAIGGPVLLALASGLAWSLSGAALRPVESMRRQAAAISVGELKTRLATPQTADEIANLARTLNEMLDRLEQAFERERRLVDDASHELRTPLGILKAEIELALRRSRSPQELTAALVSAGEEVDRMNRLAEDLLVLARSDRGKLSLYKSPQVAASLVQATVARFETLAKRKGITFRVDLSKDLTVSADELRLQQALGNLVANALAHTPSGGEILVSAERHPNGEFALCVTDSGPGFPEAFIRHAFDPFARPSAGRSRQDGGVGLGLAIVKGIAVAHGGSVTAANRPEGGAAVTLRIPV